MRIHLKPSLLTCVGLISVTPCLPIMVAFGGRDEVQVGVVFFFFNFFLNSKSCIIWVTVGYFVRKILFCYLFFNKYVWKVKQFFENLDSMALRLDLLVFFYLKLGIWFEEFCPHTGLPLQYQAVLTCAVVFDYFAQCVLVTSCPMSWGYY